MKTSVLLLLLATATLAAGKHENDLDWKKGTLIATQHTREMAGASSGHPYPDIGPFRPPVNTSLAYRTWQQFTIEGEGYSYVVVCLIYRKHTPNVTVNGPIHYAMDKGKFYMLDDDGKYFEMTVLEKALPPTPVKP
jgi:hypothetical protein